MRRFGLALFLATAAHAQEVEIPSSGMRQLPPSVSQRLLADPDPFRFRAGWLRQLLAAQQGASIVQGTLPLVIIPVLFADSEPPLDMIASTALQSRLFGESAASTITAYYREVSLGRLTVSGHVTPWTPTTFPRATVVGQSFGLGAEAKVREWLRDAVAKVDPGLDFGRFDNDGPDGIPNSGDDDGRVDGAAFLFAEVDAACGGNGVWPHRWRLADESSPGAVTDDPRPNGQMIVVDDYMTLGARNCTGTLPLEVNVFAHETGHVLGLPDYYDSSAGILREQRRWVVGCWDIMSAGSWGCGSGAKATVISPAHMGPHPKAILGWISPRFVVPEIRPQQFELRAAHSSGDALRVRLSDTEYLLVEYRARQGFDAALPASGVLVYHVESGRGFLPCPTCPRRYSYALVEADGDSALVRVETAGGNRGEGSDAFAGQRNRLDDTTIPSTRLNSGASSWVRLSRMIVDAAAGLARVTVSFAPARFTIEALVAALGRTPLTPPDAALLDAAGNSNSRYDVGDLRAYLRIQEESANQ